MNRKLALICSLGWVALISNGCRQPVDPQIVAARGQLLLSSAPEAPQSIAEAKESTVSAAEVTLVGRIDAGDFDPFDPQTAAFMLSELPTGDHDQGQGHDVDNCPFCKRRAANAPKAHVVLVDEQANPISGPASSLLDLNKGDQVIVKGSAHWNSELNLLQVTANGVYIVP